MSTTTSTSITTLPLKAGRWELDRYHSSVGFTVRHLGISKVRGQFTDFEAEIVVGDSVEMSSVTAIVQVASVDTGQPDRDTHIQADDMVDVAKRPTLAFRSTAITGTDDNWTVAGELTIGEVTKPFTLAVKLGGLAEFPPGPRHAGITATGELRRSDYGIAPGIPSAAVGDVIKIELDLELLEPADGPLS